MMQDEPSVLTEKAVKETNIYEGIRSNKWILALILILFLSISLGIIGILSSFMAIDSLNAKTGQIDNIKTAMNQWAMNTTNKINAFADDVNSIQHNQNERIANLETKISEQQAADESKTNELRASINLLNTTNTSNQIDELQIKMHRLEIMLMGLNQSVIILNETNATELTNLSVTYFYQNDYANTTCFIPLCQSWGYYCNPEWLCSASQALQEYAGWNAQACSCAREAGINV